MTTPSQNRISAIVPTDSGQMAIQYRNGAVKVINKNGVKTVTLDAPKNGRIPSIYKSTTGQMAVVYNDGTIKVINKNGAYSATIKAPRAAGMPHIYPKISTTGQMIVQYPREALVKVINANGLQGLARRALNGSAGGYRLPVSVSDTGKAALYYGQTIRIINADGTAGTTIKIPTSIGRVSKVMMSPVGTMAIIYSNRNVQMIRADNSLGAIIKAPKYARVATVSMAPTGQMAIHYQHGTTIVKVIKADGSLGDTIWAPKKATSVYRIISSTTTGQMAIQYLGTNTVKLIQADGSKGAIIKPPVEVPSSSHIYVKVLRSIMGQMLVTYRTRSNAVSVIKTDGSVVDI